jgi:hypothetical protein
VRPTGNGTPEKAESLVVDLVHVGLLIENSTEGAKSYRFAEDGMAAYLWLQSAAGKLRTDYKPTAVANPTKALAQSKTQN